MNNKTTDRGRFSKRDSQRLQSLEKKLEREVKKLPILTLSDLPEFASDPQEIADELIQTMKETGKRLLFMMCLNKTLRQSQGLLALTYGEAVARKVAAIVAKSPGVVMFGKTKGKIWFFPQQ